ncbi:2244_t:CDS:2 [Paraglomus brasilianum]|uniref:2244_t:CDS:1 n=1 Tax=Paraglomus brasilianum TaxID=144538 RepID=A0A9N8VW28_9GLOM|nr:2244_t:CDS:2 [Paraglomus brasilianum]
MELPDVGRQCADPSCRQLDYLPTKCTYCKKHYCQEHSKPEAHMCPDAPKGDGARVPTCPKCGAPIPVAKGENPNIRIERHIASGCSPVPKSTSQKSFNACSYASCKTRVAVRLICNSCNKNYCIAHRHEADHKCQGRKQGTSTQRPNRQGTASQSKVTENRSQSKVTENRRQDGKTQQHKRKSSVKSSIKAFVGKLFKSK